MAASCQVLVRLQAQGRQHAQALKVVDPLEGAWTDRLRHSRFANTIRDMSMKGQDILVLLKLAARGEQNWNYAGLASELGMSGSEVHASLKRCLKSGLYNPDSRRENRLALLEFLTHGVRYVFPAQPGPIKAGLPTSYAAEPLSRRIQYDPREAPIMPLLHGPCRGPEIEPLYPSAPKAAQKDERLYRLIALVDALRSGRARERKIAGELLQLELERSDSLESISR